MGRSRGSRESRESRESEREDHGDGGRGADRGKRLEDREEVLLIIESMKMESPGEAPCSGRLAELRVVEGDAIEEGAILALIE